MVIVLGSFKKAEYLVLLTMASFLSYERKIFQKSNIMLTPDAGAYQGVINLFFPNASGFLRGFWNVFNKNCVTVWTSISNDVLSNNAKMLLLCLASSQ